MKHIFGPVPSRRLGVSLGIDPVPEKVCSYDCVYCEVGRTTLHTNERKEYISARDILAELNQFMKSRKQHIDYITFSGSGEPTLNSKIGEMIREIKRLYTVPVAVLTNGSLLSNPEVREELLPADVVIPSLDAAIDKYFVRVNHPCCNISADDVVEGIARFSREFEGHLWLEILIVKGVNDSEENFKAVAKAVGYINPEKVQIGTVARPPGEGFAAPVPLETLQYLCKIISKDAEIVGDFSIPEEVLREQIALIDRVKNLLAIRACTFDEMTESLAVDPRTLRKLLDHLSETGQLSSRVFGETRYYKIYERKD